MLRLIRCLDCLMILSTTDRFYGKCQVCRSVSTAPSEPACDPGEKPLGESPDLSLQTRAMQAYETGDWQEVDVIISELESSTIPTDYMYEVTQSDGPHGSKMVTYY